MRRTKILILAALAFLAVASPASAQRDASVGTLFVTGKGSGEPSGGKIFFLTTMYLGTLASYGTSGYLYLDASSKIDDVEAGRADCDSVLSCRALDEEESKALDQRRFALQLFTLGGVTLLSGIVAAQLWENEQVELSVGPGSFQLTTTF